MAVNPAGEVIILDSGNNQVRKLSADRGQLSSLAGGGGWIANIRPSNYADGNGSAARFYRPMGVAVDAAGNTYVADTDNHLVRKISAAGAVTTLAGQAGVCGNQDGTGSSATLCSPTSIAVDKTGNVYVAEIKQSATLNPVGNPIRKISPTGEVTTVTSKASQYPTLVFISGPAIETYRAVHLATDSDGVLYAADPNDHVIRKYAATGQATVVSGIAAANNQGDTDGAASTAKFNDLKAIAFDTANRLYVLDWYTRPAIRQIGSDGSVTTLVRANACNFAGEGSGAGPGTLCTAEQMAVTPDGRFLVSELGMSYSDALTATVKYAQLRSYTSQGTSTVVAGTPSAEGVDDGQGSSARFDAPGSIALNPEGTLYVRDSGDRTIRTIRTVQTDGTVRTLGKPGGHCAAIAGLGDAVLSGTTAPLTTDGAGNLYTFEDARIFKTANCQAVLLADLAPWLDKVPTSFLGVASGIAADSTGNVYVASLKGAIFKIDAKGEVALFAGSVGTVGHVDGQGSAAQFSALGHMTTDAAGNVYVVDGLYHDINKVGPTIRKITPSGLVSTLAGSPSAEPGYADGPAATARFSVHLGKTQPRQTSSLAVDAKGNVYVTDPFNSVVRKIGTDGQVGTFVGQAWKYGFAAGDLPGIINRPTGIAVRNSMMYLTVPNAVLQVKLP
jgi:sugar lactone lactonase YvrE